MLRSGCKAALWAAQYTVTRINSRIIITATMVDSKLGQTYTVRLSRTRAPPLRLTYSYLPMYACRCMAPKFVRNDLSCTRTIEHDDSS